MTDDAPPDDAGWRPWLAHQRSTSPGRRTAAECERLPAASAQRRSSPRPIGKWAPAYRLRGRGDRCAGDAVVHRRRSLQANSDLCSWRCRVARRPIRGNAIRTQTGGTRGSPQDLAPASSRRHQMGTSVHSACHTGGPDFQHFVDYGIPRTSLDRRSMPPVTALMRRVRMDVEAALSWATAGKYVPKYRKARLSLIFER